MQEDIRRRHITGIIFSKLARLTRNTKELLEFSEFFRDHQADLISLQEPRRGAENQASKQSLTAANSNKSARSLSPPSIEVCWRFT
jgi:DNA invertase Pin-like site-specific DNA recombinase